MDDREQAAQSDEREEQIEERWTRRESRVIAFNAALAGMVVAVIFIAAGFLFILFCLNIWFR